MRYLVTAEWVVDDEETARRLTGALASAQGADTAVMRPLPDLPEGFHRGCSREGCACHRPGPVCEECMCADGQRHCARCGWLHDKHPLCRWQVKS
jgi:hypothetical protein